MSRHLRDRFVAGAGAGKDPGETGGANTIVLTQNELPAHSHSLTINAVGDHKHGVPVPWTGAPMVPAVSYANTVPASSLGNMLTEAGGAHTHSGSIGSAGSGQGFDNRPAYLKLAFIMKL